MFADIFTINRSNEEQLKPYERDNDKNETAIQTSEISGRCRQSGC